MLSWQELREVQVAVHLLQKYLKHSNTKVKEKISLTVLIFDAMSMVIYKVLGKNFILKLWHFKMIMCLNHGVYLLPCTHVLNYLVTSP